MKFVEVFAGTSAQTEAEKDDLSFDEMTLLYVRFLRVLGLLPFEGRGYEFFISRVLELYFLLSNCVECSMFVGYGVNHIMTEGKLELDYISETIPVIGIWIKYTILLVCRTELQELFVDSREIWKDCTMNERLVVKSFEQRIRFLFKFFLGSNIIAFICYVCISVTTRLPPVEPNGPERRIPMFRYYVDSIGTSPAYELIFALQVVLSCNTVTVLVSGDTVVPLLIMLSCGYLKVVQDRLVQVYEMDDTLGVDVSAEIYQELVVCSKLHQSVLNVCTKIKRFTPIFFVQLLCTGYVLSLVGIKFASSDPDKYKFVSMFLLFVIQLYICQWAPDILIQESESVSTAAYFASLSKTSNLRSRKLLSIVIRRAQRPVTLTAAGVIKLSIETFGSMITSALSFFVTLRNFTMKGNEAHELDI